MVKRNARTVFGTVLLSFLLLALVSIFWPMQTMPRWRARELQAISSAQQLTTAAAASEVFCEAKNLEGLASWGRRAQNEFLAPPSSHPPAFASLTPRSAARNGTP
jgi:hypothetical protein